MKEMGKQVQQLYYKVEDLVYRDGLATIKFNQIEQQSARILTLEFESQKHKSDTTEAVAEFKLQNDVFRERLYQCELEAESSRRVGQMCTQQLNRHEGHFNDFKEVHAEELGALKAELMLQIGEQNRRIEEQQKQLALLVPQIADQW